jgi:glycosyltransferase involved in cell wall biosynthesis
VSYIARVDNWKRQHLLILAIANLKENYNLRIPAYIVGDVITESYGDKLKALAKANEVEDLIHFTGGLLAAEAAYIMSHSSLTCSLYHTSNLGNVFLEALSIGTPVVAINCGGSLDEIPSDAYISVDEDVESISQGLKSHWNDESAREEIKEKAIDFARDNIRSWTQRVNLEYDLILKNG